MESTAKEDPAQLSLWDAISLMIGIVVGTSLFVSPRMVFSSVPDGAAGMAVWAVGGVLSTVGALLFAELAVSFPRGGAYTYLTAAFGRAAGLVYGVSVLSVMLTANIGAMAFAFARYSKAVLTNSGMDLKAAEQLGPWLAAGAVTVLAVFNTRGFQTGRITQNVLTTAKLLGLGLIVVAGIWTKPAVAGVGEMGPVARAAVRADYGLAMVFVLYAFGGWSDAATVAAEVRNRSKNIPKALVGGLAGVTLIYLAVNAAYVHGLGFDAIRESALPASDVVRRAWGQTAAQGVSLLVMISALGAVQGMLFSGSRAVAAMGEDHRVFRSLGVWNEATHVPARAVWSLASVSLMQIAVVGTERGRQLVDAVLKAVGLSPVAWLDYGDGFDVLVIGSAPTFWALMLGVGVAFFVLRAKGLTPREFRAPGGPVVPLVYLGTCGFMFLRAAAYAGVLGLVGLVSCAVGVVLAVFGRWGGRSERSGG